MDNELTVSLSFSSYSTNHLAATAVKISNEFNDPDDDFEFSLVLVDQGQVRHNDFLDHTKIYDDSSIKFPSSKLFGNDREEYSSSSELPTDKSEMEALPESPFCFWRPTKRKSSSNGGRCKSKGWKQIFCDLIRRINISGNFNRNGKRIFNFSDWKHNYEKADRKPGAMKKKNAAPAKLLGSPMEEFYVRNKAQNEGVKRKSYLPYRQRLLGLL